MDWVGTLGGPLIVVPAGIARRWRGANFLTRAAERDPRLRQWANPPREDDYARACAVRDWLGTVPVGRNGHGLVLSGDRMPASFVSTEGGGLIIRLSWTDSPDGILEVARSAPESFWVETSCRLRLGRGGLLMFDSVHAGDDLPTEPGEEASVPWMRLRLTPGPYRIDTAVWDPDPSTQLVLHRLRSDPETGR